MTQFPYILFNQTPETLRRIGSRGGKAQARNRRALRRTVPAPPSPAGARLAIPFETTAAAITLLNARFPWLRGVEFRCRKCA
jgi:hypothetical protein